MIVCDYPHLPLTTVFADPSREYVFCEVTGEYFELIFDPDDEGGNAEMKKCMKSDVPIMTT